MTEEIPLVVCYECRTPMKEPFARLRGEVYCRKCGPDAVRRHSRANRGDEERENPVGK